MPLIQKAKSTKKNTKKTVISQDKVIPDVSSVISENVSELASKKIKKKKERKFVTASKFGLILDAENRSILKAVASECQNAENWIWNILRINDPVDHNFMINQKRGDNGKFPPILKYDYKIINGKTPYNTAMDMCEITGSNIVATISYEVVGLYNKMRLDILRNKKKLPIAMNPMIRFKNSSIRIIKDGKDFLIKIYLLRKKDNKLQPPVVAKLYTKRQNKHWIKFLQDNCGKNIGPCGGKIVCKDGRWSILLCRDKSSEEVKNYELREDCTAYLYSSDDCFLKIRMEGRDNKPWFFDISDEGYLGRIDSQYFSKKKSRGKNFAQCRTSAARGHGIKRKNATIIPKSKKENIDRYFIENTTDYILETVANVGKCLNVFAEDLVNRSGEKNVKRIKFPYYKFMNRLRDKAKERGIILSVVNTDEIKECINEKFDETGDKNEE